LATIEYCSENYEDAIEFLEKVYALDTNNTNIHRAFGEFYMMTGNYVKTLEHLKKWLEKTESLSEDLLFGMHRVGWAYWKNGNKEQGEHYFNEQINYCNRMKELGRVYGGYSRIYYDLAGVYAFMGEKEKAYENLKIRNQELLIPDSWGLQLIKNDPLFDSLRNEPEFQQIVKDVETKYQEEHERVRKWLEEQGM
jgi:tetratricopeptide (TPR) repeat protein